MAKLNDAMNTVFGSDDSEEEFRNSRNARRGKRSSPEPPVSGEEEEELEAAVGSGHGARSPEDTGAPSPRGGTDRGYGGGTGGFAKGNPSDVERAVFGDSDEDEGAEEEHGRGVHPSFAPSPTTRTEAEKAVFGDSDEDEDSPGLGAEEGGAAASPQVEREATGAAAEEPDQWGEEEDARWRSLEDEDADQGAERVSAGEATRRFVADEEQQPGKDAELDEAMEEGEGGEGMAEDFALSQPRPVAPPLDLELPLKRPPAAADKMGLVLASNIVGFEMQEFDPDSYEEEGAGTAQNVIRWRRVRQRDGSHRVESNARIVKWSDGSMHLLLGSDVLAVDRMSMAQDNSHLFLHHAASGAQGSALQAQGRMLQKMRFRPLDTRSRIHKKLTLGMESKYRRTAGVKNAIMQHDPEKDLEERTKELRRDMRLREKQQLKMERLPKPKASGAQRGWEQVARGQRRGGDARWQEENEEEDAYQGESDGDGGPAERDRRGRGRGRGRREEFYREEGAGKRRRQEEDEDEEEEVEEEEEEEEEEEAEYDDEAEEGEEEEDDEEGDKHGRGASVEHETGGQSQGLSKGRGGSVEGDEQEAGSPEGDYAERGEDGGGSDEGGGGVHADRSEEARLRLKRGVPEGAAGPPKSKMQRGESGGAEDWGPGEGLQGEEGRRAPPPSGRRKVLQDSDEE